jgi:protoporphyrinogen/coproporphyrinogen III oxidase
VLGCLYRSTIFPSAAPDGRVLLTVFLGGVRNPHAAGMRQAELVAIVQRELAATIGLRGEPEKIFVRAWPQAIPQYERGHTQLAARARAWSAAGPVSIIGNMLSGLSIPDCITAGREEADRLLPRLSSTSSNRHTPSAAA